MYIYISYIKNIIYPDDMLVPHQIIFGRLKAAALPHRTKFSLRPLGPKFGQARSATRKRGMAGRYRKPPSRYIS